MNAVCQCGAVAIQLPSISQPPKVYNCHCSECRAQSSSAFGTTAVFPDFNLPVATQPIGVWTRATFRPEYVKDCYFCRVCGVRIAHRNRSPDEPREEQDSGNQSQKYEAKADRNISIKGGCIENLDWSKAVHIYCGDAVTNLEFPEEVEKYVEDDEGEKWTGRKVRQ